MGIFMGVSINGDPPSSLVGLFRGQNAIENTWMMMTLLVPP